jgi:2-phosphosulfolactate phosphatase
VIDLSVILSANYNGTIIAREEKAIAIVVDTLRASTTMPVLMKKGLERILVAKEVDDARKLAEMNDLLLIGERGCKKLPGFDYGNSPTEIMALDSFQRLGAAFTSSTGAKRITESIGARAVIVGSPINAAAVAQVALDLVKSLDSSKTISIVIIAAFSEGSIITHKLTEDQIGGLLVAREFAKKGIIITDSLREEIDFLEKKLKNNSLSLLLQQTDHGKKLMDLGFEADIDFCSQINCLTNVPVSIDDHFLLDAERRIVTLKDALKMKKK